MDIIIHNRTITNLNLKLSPISTESDNTINIPLNQSKMILTQTKSNVLELFEGEFPLDIKRFYEVESPAELLVNKIDEVSIFDDKRNLQKLNYCEEKDKEFFESNTIHIVNLSSKFVYARIDNPGYCDDLSDFFEIGPGGFIALKRNLNDFFILQVGIEKGKNNGTNYIVKAGYEFSVTDGLNVISNLTAKIYYTIKNWNNFVYSNDVLSI